MTNETRRVQGAEQRLQFLLDLGDGLRTAESPAEIAYIAVEMLGNALNADGAGQVLVDQHNRLICIGGDWHKSGSAPPVVSGLLQDAFDADAMAELRSGRTIVVETDRFFIDPQPRSVIVAPLANGGTLSGLIYVHAAPSRQWREQEVELAKHANIRVWSTYMQARTEAALRQSEERLRDITDALPVLISYLGTDQRFQFANRPYETWFGRPREQIIGRTVAELMPPGAYEARRPFIEQALAGNEVKFEVDMPLRDDIRKSEVLFLPHRDNTGETVGIYALVQDITDRNQAEVALRQSELKFRQFAEQNPAMIWSCDEAGRLTYLSSRWYEYTGQNPDTPLNMSWDAVVHPDDRTLLHGKWAAALATRDIYDLEVRFLRYDGVYRWHSIRGEPLQNNGSVSGWLGTNSDIQDAVAEREERKRDHDRLWQISQEMMVVRDQKGIIISANPSASRILGWQHEELIGKSVYELIHPEDLDQTIHKVGTQLAGKGMLSVQNRYRCKDGSYRTLDWRGVLHEGHVHSVGRDITAELQATEELQRAEEALRQSQKMETVGRLTGGIAHDFNNMLAGIIGSLNLLQRRINSGRLEDTARFIEAAQSSAQRAAALTQRLLAFGRRQALDVKPVDVSELIASLDDLLRRTIGPSIALRIEVEADLWLASADINQLESALLNLAINARDAMPDGGTLTLGARHAVVTTLVSAPAGDYVEVFVTDTGQGMTQEVMRQAFEPFFTTKPPGQGTGLGLSMVYGFVSQIGGDARIESKVGTGTTIKLYLPRSSRAMPSVERDDVVSAPIGSGETVLLVEDDQSVRMLVEEVLSELGYIGLSVGDAPSALPVIRSNQKIDLMISDIGLPGMNGRDLAEIARRHRPELRILFITGYAEAAANRKDFLAPGMQILTKPFNLEQLALKINAMLGGRGNPAG